MKIVKSTSTTECSGWIYVVQDILITENIWKINVFTCQSFVILETFTILFNHFDRLKHFNCFKKSV